MQLIGEHQAEDRQLIADMVVARMNQALPRTPARSPQRPTTVQPPQSNVQKEGLTDSKIPTQRPPPQGGPGQPQELQSQSQETPSEPGLSGPSQDPAPKPSPAPTTQQPQPLAQGAPAPGKPATQQSKVPPPKPLPPKPVPPVRQNSKPQVQPKPQTPPPPVKAQPKTQPEPQAQAQAPPPSQDPTPAEAKPPTQEQQSAQQKAQPHPQLNKSQSLTNAFSAFSDASFFRSSNEDEAKAETIRNLRKSFASLFSD
ncbi:hypothetical protein JZ751_017606 [Albula glossodonta]|nr:hypothetical protein JZ751_017606 [Albula glossodonta]